MSSPSPTPVSTRSPGPLGSRNISTRPGVGANPSAGSSAFRRASIAWPLGWGGSPSRRPPAATWSWSLTQVEPCDRLGHWMLDLEPSLTSMNENDRSTGW